jgi:hypothetical protein
MEKESMMRWRSRGGWQRRVFCLSNYLRILNGELVNALLADSKH